VSSTRQLARKRAVPLPDLATDRTAKILIVDDDERNLLALTQVLEPLAQVVTATSGKNALRALLKDDFAVILLDVFMPEMDGYETAHFIREREQTARIPIIFLSAVNKETEHLMRGYRMGAVDYVFKPVDPLVLSSKASVFVDLYNLRREIEERTTAERELNEAKARAEKLRLKTQRELQAARLRQAAILNSLPLVLFEADYSEQDGLRRRVVGGDRSSLPEEAASRIQKDGSGWEEQIHPEDRDAVSRAYVQQARSGDRATVRYRWATGEGSPLHFLEQAVRIDQNAWVGSITDVTAQSALEDQLLQAQKLDALGHLTGGVAHDFNNLLAAMLGGIELLRRRRNLAEADLRVLDQMRHAADQGVALVKSLLAFARKQPLSPSVVDPREIARTVGGLAEHAMGDGISVQWQLNCNGCHFFADASQLTLALFNLLINARDATATGGTIKVGIDHQQPGGAEAEQLRITVRDRGAGIPPEVLAKVTEPFFTTKPAGKGTGLGLSMVAGFVEQSGGKLAIRSRLGEGTIVELFLPAVLCGEAEAPAAENIGSRSRSNNRSSLLLVDDDDGVRTILAEIIEELGTKVTTAGNGREALDILKRQPDAFHLVLTDVAMPVMNGVELLESVREQKLGVSVALMTGNINDELLSRVGPETQILPKPLESEALAQLLADCGETHRSVQAL
jgi:signal transduction histidine kinase